MTRPFFGWDEDDPFKKEILDRMQEIWLLLQDEMPEPHYDGTDMPGYGSRKTGDGTERIQTYEMRRYALDWTITLQLIGVGRWQNPYGTSSYTLTIKSTRTLGITSTTTLGYDESAPLLFPQIARKMFETYPGGQYAF